MSASYEQDCPPYEHHAPDMCVMSSLVCGYSKLHMCVAIHLMASGVYNNYRYIILNTYMFIVHVIHTVISDDPLVNFIVSHRHISQGIPYDYLSIMHYKAYAASKNRRLTIQPVNSSMSLEVLGSAPSPTSFDYLHINLAYCEGETASCIGT